MGFCGEMVAKADAGEGDGRERGGRGDAWAGSQARRASLLSNKKRTTALKTFHFENDSPL